MIDATKFRTDFPEFADEAKYTPAMVEFWLKLAVLRLNEKRWADLYDFGIELFVAHQLVLATKNLKTAGVQVAPVASKSVDKVSVSYDTSAVTLDNAGHWSTTNYGQQFWQLLLMAGAGGVQV